MATRKKRTTKKRASRKPAADTTGSELDVLDFTGTVARRPVVKFEHGDYRMLLLEELTFDQFSKQAGIGKRLVEIGEDTSEPGVLDDLHSIIVEGVRILMVDMPDAAAQKVTPGQYFKISAFFNKLGGVDAATPSEAGSSDAPDASDSTERSEAA